MIQEELELGHRFEVGQIAWWTHGLTYWVCTYKPGGKIRPESKERVRIEAVDEELILPLNGSVSCRTVRVFSFEDDRDYFVNPCWLSHSENQPCEAVIEAYT